MNTEMDIQTVIEALKQQRNEALDKCVMLEGILALRDKQNKELAANQKPARKPKPVKEIPNG